MVFRITPLVLLMALGCRAQTANASGAAVVELFTSEGCSSCPPAERVATEIEKSAKGANQPVYVLAFHVDYWNRLGWVDRFSDRAYSQRQNNYAAKLKLDNVYTPQIIVNGTEQFVGSDRSRATSEISAALAKAVPVEVTASASATGKQITVDYQLKNATTSDVVNVAIVESGLSTDVKRGENAGEHLAHPATVRGFNSMPVSVDGHGQATVKVDEVNLSNASAVVYVQDAETFAVRGASGVAITIKP